MNLLHHAKVLKKNNFEKMQKMGLTGVYLFAIMSIVPKGNKNKNRKR